MGRTGPDQDRCRYGLIPSHNLRNPGYFEVIHAEIKTQQRIGARLSTSTPLPASFSRDAARNRPKDGPALVEREGAERVGPALQSP